MKAIVERVAHSSDAKCAVHEIDITGDAALEAAYGLEIPVLLVDGKKAAKYRVSEVELRRVLTERAGTTGKGR
jgi:hypothetical protein